VFYNEGRVYNQDGSEYGGEDEFVLEVMKALNHLGSGEEGKYLVTYLAGHSRSVVIGFGRENKISASGRSLMFDPRNNTSGVDINGSTYAPAYINLGHELAHARDAFKGTINLSMWYSSGRAPVPEAEKHATHVENMIRNENNIPLRAYYGRYDNGKPYEPSSILIGTNVSRFVTKTVSVSVTGFGEVRCTVPYVYK